MGKRQRGCVGCGAAVGIIGRDYCSRCTARQRDQANRNPCTSCGKNLVLDAQGLCVRCARLCAECGHLVRSADATLCKTCRRRADLAAAKRPCPRCGEPGLLRPGAGWCGSCSRRRRPKDPPRVCQGCGQLRPHAGLGYCSACWQRHPDRAFIRGANLDLELPDPPDWLADFVGYVGARHSPARAVALISALGRLLADPASPNHPQTLLERAAQPGRSVGPLARALDGFFVERRLALPPDHAGPRAAQRRQRRIDDAPAALRPAVAAFAATMISNQDRARRSGTRHRADHTLEHALAITRDLARFVDGRGKADWALVDVHDIEAFLAQQPKARARRLVVLRQFFRLTRQRRIVLVDPTQGLRPRTQAGFTGPTLTLAGQRELFRRWTADPTAHPHEALLGLLALLHGASSEQVRMLGCDDLDQAGRAVRLGRRPQPVQLDPASWTQVERALDYRDSWGTANPHLVVTRGTKAGTEPASVAYFTKLLSPCGVTPRTVRCTRLADLVNTIDPKMVAAAFGMNPQAAMFYLTDQVDQDRLTAVAAGRKEPR